MEMNRLSKIMLNILIIGLALATIWLYAAYPAVLDRVCCEDGMVEWLTAFFYFAAAAIFIQLCQKQRWKNIWLGGLAVMFFVVAGEEISWGQRILGIESPDALKQLNVQQEINLHNLHGVHDKIRALGLLIVLGICYLLPFTNKFSATLAVFYTRLKLPIYPLWVVALPTLALLFMIAPRLLWGKVIFSLDELGEFYLACGFLLFALTKRNINQTCLAG